MTLVRGTTPGKLSVQIIDATRNKKGFEYVVSDILYKHLQVSKVPLASTDVKRPANLTELEEACRGSFNALLYIAHGGHPDGKEAATVQAGDFVTTWYLLQHLNLNLADKLVCLCVCHGYNDDTINTLPEGSLFALTMVAPNAAISGWEAIRFFPNFFASLTPLCLYEVDPNVVRDKMQESNHLANGKMQIFSPGLSA